MIVICETCGQDMNGAGIDTCKSNQWIVYPDGLKLRTSTYHDRNTRCHDCNIKNGGKHHSGCDVEQCPRCKGQRISCGCEDRINTDILRKEANSFIDTLTPLQKVILFEEILSTVLSETRLVIPSLVDDNSFDFADAVRESYGYESDIEEIDGDYVEYFIPTESDEARLSWVSSCKYMGIREDVMYPYHYDEATDTYVKDTN